MINPEFLAVKKNLGKIWENCKKAYGSLVLLAFIGFSTKRR
jgi:hypothetical protein